MLKILPFMLIFIINISYGLTESQEKWLQQQQTILKQKNFTPYEIKTISNLLIKGLEDPSSFAKKLTQKPSIQHASYARYQFSKAPLGEYIKYHVTDKRVDTGMGMMHHYHCVANEIQKQYQVQPEYFIAIWGIETFYGKDLPEKPTIEMLAPLAYSGRRTDYFTKELNTAYTILAQNSLTVRVMKGSESADMGQPQFQPSSFVMYAVDFNKDGRRDIWHDPQDVLASIANYLQKSGWHAGESWGMEVKVPKRFKGKHGYHYKKPIAHWQNHGIKTMNGEVLPEKPFEASLLLYDGIDGPAYLLFPNFEVLMRWNPTYYEAVSIGVLADKISEDKDLNHPICK